MTRSNLLKVARPERVSLYLSRYKAKEIGGRCYAVRCGSRKRQTRLIEQAVRRSLARHIDGPPASLDLVLPVDRHMNHDLCDGLKADLTLHCSPWEVMRATPTLWQQLPNSPGLYMFVFASALSIQREAPAHPFRPAWVLYVGRAGCDKSKGTLRSRYKSEYHKYVEADPEILWSRNPAQNRAERVARCLAVWPLQFWFTVVENAQVIPDLEERLIRLLNPPANHQQGRRIHYGPAEPAF